MIKLKQINKYYNKGKENEIHVIHDVNLELPNTGLVSFLGPSGSGKTTLLNVIGGLDKAKGSISYDEIEIEKYKMNKVDKIRSQQIGYVFQNYNLLLEETVYSNLAIALEMIGIYDEEEQIKRIEYTLKAVGMYKYRKKRAYALSGGQQQRVSIARALVKQAKIIIADEPTGNLDSENTIEVMNILKKISKSSLVLMVTHNEEVANFYSDQVIRIKDGAILDRYMCDENQTLQTEQGNTVYLKDLKCSDLTADQAQIHLYTAEGQSPELNLDIIYRNGTFYLNSTQKIKFVSQSNLKVLDQHYEALKQEHIEQFEYDTSWYKDTTRKENPFKKFGKAILKSFNKMRFAKKKTKFVYFAFILIGVMLATCLIGYANFMTIDDSNVIADPYYSQISSDSYLDYSQKQEFLSANFLAGTIRDAQEPIKIKGQISKYVNYNEKMNASFEFNAISTSNRELEMVFGTTPTENQMVLSRKIADEIIRDYGYFYPTYESLQGVKVNISSKDVYFPKQLTISGVVNSTTNLCFISDKDYLSSYRYIVFTSEINKLTFPTIVRREWMIERKYEDVYTIVKGRDLTESDMTGSPLNILMPADYPEAQKYLDGETFTQYWKNPMNDNIIEPIAHFKVVGLYEANGTETGINDFIGCFTSYEPELSAFVDSHETYAYTPHKIIEGREATSYKEAIASIYSKYKIGDYIGDVEIVGKYVSTKNYMDFQILYHRDFVVSKNVMECWFYMENEQSLVQPETDIIQIQNSYNYIVEPLLAEHKVEQLVFGLTSIATFVVLALFIYLMMRSRMVSDIKSIGIYRSLGQPRRKIFGQFMIDILISITLTSLLGYLVPILLFDIFVYNFNSTLLIRVAEKLNGYIGLGVLALYILNIFFGLLPIYFLLKKTPAEILSKYDI